jgi:hypothetical protein
MERKFSLYDSPLLNNFSDTSTSEAADLNKVFDDTLVQHIPVNAVVSTSLPYISFAKQYLENYLKIFLKIISSTSY